MKLSSQLLPQNRSKISAAKLAGIVSSLLLTGATLLAQQPAVAQRSEDRFSAMCRLYLKGRIYMETCDIIEARDGQWRRGLKVVAPIRGYELRMGIYSGCPKSSSTWDSVTKSCYSFSWSGEALPGNEGAKCESDQYGTKPCGLMTTDQQLIRISPHLAVQGLTFG